jgi:hypothetical protein
MILIPLIFAFVCFVLATIPPAAPHWNKLVSAGLAFWVFVAIYAYKYSF